MPATRKKKAVAVTPLDAVLAAVRKGFGQNAALRMVDGARSLVKEVIPIGIDVLDHYVFGCGGFPVGRITELYSEEGAGKTSLVLAALGAAQRQNGLAIYGETENGVDEDRAAMFGADPKQLVLLEAPHMEGLLARAEAAIEALPRRGSPSMFVWDSIAATPTKLEVEKGVVGDAAVAERARLLSRACRVLPTLAVRHRVALVFVNQTREKMGVIFGDKTTTPGGKAVKFAASLRLQMFPGKSVKNKYSQHVGKAITILATKNRFAPPYRKAKVQLNFNRGWDNDWSTLKHAKQLCVPGMVNSKVPAAERLERARAHFAEHGWDRGGDGTSEDLVTEARQRLGEEHEGDDDADETMA